MHQPPFAAMNRSESRRLKYTVGDKEIEENKKCRAQSIN